MFRDYRKIKAWQSADRLTKSVYQATKYFPKEESYGITSQLRRAVVSVPCNIVEGASRRSSKEYIQFLYIAKASLAEAEYLLSLSHSLSYCSSKKYKEIDELSQETAKILTGLINYIISNA